MIFLMMRISLVDNVEHYLFKGILYCESVAVGAPWMRSSYSFVLIVHLCIQHNSGGIKKKIYPY